MKRAVVFILLLAIAFSGVALFYGQEAVPAAKAQEAKAKAEPEKIVPAPQNIKEATAIYVFLGWMWVSIAVLIYFLRLKIKEADRLYKIKYLSPDKK